MYFKLIFALILANGILTTFSQCIVDIIDDKNGLEIWKEFGSRQLKMQSVNKGDKITIQMGTNIEVRCINGFANPSNYKEQNRLNIRCTYNYHNNLVAVVNREISTYESSSRISISCKPLSNTYNVNLFEAQPFSWCNPKYASYIVEGIRTQDKFLSAICYDSNKMKLISIYYPFRSIYTKMNPPVLENYPLGTKAKSTPEIREIFTMKTLNTDMYDSAELKNWYIFSNYQYFSIIQNQYLFEHIFKDFGSLLDVIWWPSLHLGNWKLYENQLAKQNEKEPFNIFAGVSEIVKVPLKNDCNQIITMVELKDNKSSDHVPLYIWNYLESSLNSSNSYVIIGINTPFYEYYVQNDIIFCKDICNEIDWLEGIPSTFRYSAMGVVFCCSVDEVRESNRLNGFPVNISMPEIEETTTTETETTETETTEAETTSERFRFYWHGDY